jgi:hypothetical protein
MAFMSRALAAMLALFFLVGSVPFAACALMEQAAARADKAGEAGGCDAPARECDGDCASHCERVCCGQPPLAVPGLLVSLDGEAFSEWSAASAVDRPVEPEPVLPLHPPRG